MTRFILKSLLVLSVAVMLSVGLDSLYRKTYRERYDFPPKNLWILPEIPNKYDLVSLGNSHSESGITFVRYKRRSLVLASVAQSFEYDLASLKMHAKEIKDGAVVIINISPVSFSQKKPGREDSLQTVYYDGRLSPFLIPHLKIEDYLQVRVFPFLRAGYSWRDKIETAVRDRISHEQQPEQSLPTVKTATGSGTIDPDYFARVSVIRKLLASPPASPSSRFTDSMNFVFNKWYRTDEFGTQYFDANRRDLENLIDYALKMHWRPVLVTVPVSQVLLKGLFPDYMQVYVYDNLRKTDLRGIEYFDFTSDELTKHTELYADTDHLNGRGASVFSYLLLQRLIDHGYLTKSSDGYIY